MGAELLIAEDSNTVAVHTELFNDVTYSQLVRLLFNFMSSQVATIWLLPVIFLQSIYWNKIKRKRKLLRDVDRLTPPLTLAVILLSVPNLVNNVAVIALFQPTHIMVMTSTLCLSI